MAIPAIKETSMDNDSSTHTDNNQPLSQLELILSSPTQFTPTTPEEKIFPLLREVESLADVGSPEERDRIRNLSRWSKLLEDCCRAAYSRDEITRYLKEVESWPEWNWDEKEEKIEFIRRRIEEIKTGIGSLPIEWLKSRVTGIHPPFLN